MTAELQRIEYEQFVAALARTGHRLDAPAYERPWTHYTELVRWNRRLSLIGPGTFDDVVERHYGESLAALALLEPDDSSLVDLGSGAGFPGFVLAAARPDLDVTLVEARQKKWSFLSLVCQKAALPCHCLGARVTMSFPDGFPQRMDLITTRAVKFSADEIEALAGRLTPTGRILAWVGSSTPAAFASLRPGGEVALGESRSRRILELFPSRGEESPRGVGPKAEEPHS